MVAEWTIGIETESKNWRFQWNYEWRAEVTVYTVIQTSYGDGIVDRKSKSHKQVSRRWAAGDFLRNGDTRIEERCCHSEI